MGWKLVGIESRKGFWSNKIIASATVQKPALGWFFCACRSPPLP